jgi:hypothetical protein
MILSPKATKVGVSEYFCSVSGHFRPNRISSRNDHWSIKARDSGRSGFRVNARTAKTSRPQMPYNGAALFTGRSRH